MMSGWKQSALLPLAHVMLLLFCVIMLSSAEDPKPPAINVPHSPLAPKPEVDPQSAASGSRPKDQGQGQQPPNQNPGPQAGKAGNGGNNETPAPQGEKGGTGIAKGDKPTNMETMNTKGDHPPMPQSPGQTQKGQGTLVTLIDHIPGTGPGNAPAQPGPPAGRPPAGRPPVGRPPVGRPPAGRPPGGPPGEEGPSGKPPLPQPPNQSLPKKGFPGDLTQFKAAAERVPNGPNPDQKPEANPQKQPNKPGGSDLRGDVESNPGPAGPKPGAPGKVIVPQQASAEEKGRKEESGRRGGGGEEKKKTNGTRSRAELRKTLTHAKYVTLTMFMVVSGVVIMALAILSTFTRQRRRRQYDRCRGLGDDCELRSNFQMVNHDERLGIRTSRNYLM